MMTPRKRRAIIVLIIAVIVLILIWLLSFLFSGTPKVTVETDEVNNGAFEQLDAEETISDKEFDKEQEVRNASSDVISISKTFVERYGSYSNESDFANIKDVLPLMTNSFAKNSQKFIDSTPTPEGYYGVTTRVITVKVDGIKEDAESGSVLITTQREESKDSSENSEVKYQDVLIDFVKEAGVWKVDSATWQ
jgi:hypothetical protein